MRALLLLALLQTPVTTSSPAPVIPSAQPAIPPDVVTKVLPAYFFQGPGQSLIGAETALKVELVIDNFGAVKSTKVVDAGQAAADVVGQTIAALNKWRFEPGRVNGAAVPSRVTASVTFTSTRRGRASGPSSVALLPKLSVDGATDSFAKGTYPIGEPGLSSPKERKFDAPTIPSGSRKRNGTVVLEAVVGTSGTIDRARVTLPVDADLDAEALRTVKKWTFEPGRKDGLLVPVLITLEVMFR